MVAPTIAKLSGKFTFRRGVHPPHNKGLTENLPIETLPLAPGQEVVIPMSQHIGAPNAPTVEEKQQVVAGQAVGASDAFVSAPVHSPVNGAVKKIEPRPHPTGRKVLSVVITVGDEQPQPQQWQQLTADIDPEKYASTKIIDAIRAAGLVGQGGAAFPTAVKLVQNPHKPINTVIINGCECEPYLTSDYRLMLEAPAPIVAGLRLALRAAGAQRGIIALEDNKPEAIQAFRDAIKDLPDIELAICQTKYPQGGERQLIMAVLKRAVPTGGLPLDVGVVVINAGTAAAIAWACLEGRPCTERIVTVTGAGINKPGNFRVPVGMMLADLLEHCGGLTEKAEKVLLGGPMMGPAAPHFNLPILKGTSGITVLTKKDLAREPEMPCIKCSRCVDHCPLKLVPTRIAHAVKARNIEMAMDYDLSACIECGCCMYICPSKIPLVQYMKSGKALAQKAKQKQKAT
jgi:electron transport complex protein RnfC